VNHRQLISGNVEPQLVPILLQRLPYTGDVSMTEYAKHTGEKPIADAISLHVLLREKTDQSLGSCESSCCHPAILKRVC
jgi:hypothetical protein